LSEIQNDSAPEQEEEAPVIRKRRGPLARLGCALGLLIWAILILLPCILITLAVQGEINISTGDAPDQRLRIWLIMESAQRGIGISNVSIHEQDNGQTCLQTDTRFILWQGKADPVSYCECYQHEAGSEDWIPVEMTSEACAP